MLGAWARHIPGFSLLCGPGHGDRRNDVRYQFRVHLEVRAAGRTYSARTINGSAGGLLIDRALPVRRGSAVRLTADGFPRSVGGRVTRTGAHSTAISIDMPSAGQELLAWALRQPASKNAANDGYRGASANLPVRRVSPHHRRQAC